MTRASCRTCLFAGLEPADDASAWGQGNRFVRTCALGKRLSRQPHGCASWARDPGEDLGLTAFQIAVSTAREQRP